MNDLKVNISKEEFKELSDDEKLHMIYKAILGHEPRICKLERRKLKDSGIATVAGAIAGFLGGLLKGHV